MARHGNVAEPISQGRAQRRDDASNDTRKPPRPLAPTTRPHAHTTTQTILTTKYCSGNKRLCFWAAGAAQTCTELHRAAPPQQRIWIRHSTADAQDNCICTCTTLTRNIVWDPSGWPGLERPFFWAARIFSLIGSETSTAALLDRFQKSTENRTGIAPLIIVIIIIITTHYRHHRGRRVPPAPAIGSSGSVSAQ